MVDKHGRPESRAEADQLKYQATVLGLLGEIRDLLKVAMTPPRVVYNADVPHRLVEEQVQAVNAEPMDNTNLWGTR